MWWDAFATEFFEDDATLTLTFCLEDGPKRYSMSLLLSDAAQIRSISKRDLRFLESTALFRIPHHVRDLS